MTRVLVTGASGFVGSILCPVLAQAGYVVRAALRSSRAAPAGVTESVVVGDIGDHTNWTEALRNVELVIHLAARAHTVNARTAGTELYAQINAHGTRRLATQSASQGITRFVYLSTVKVNGEDSGARPYSAEDVPRPLDAYATSKWLGEQALWRVAAGTAIQAAVVRSPLVYGPGVRANFLRLLRWVDRERLLPLGAICNQRSVVSVWNLCDLLLRVIEDPAAPGRVWMVSDGADVSTPDLVRVLGRAMGRQVRLVSVPVSLLYLAGTLSARRAEIGRLCGSLVIDISETRSQLNWTPPVPLQESLERTVAWYLAEGRSDAR
jgi:UDP-N-acetyl-alpha-D-quinovosamine dehydrogenase